MDSDRAVLVTGASSGIGAAAARRLAQKGYRLALVARRKERLETLAAELGRPDTLVLAADIAQPGAARTVVERTAGHFGRLDVLVNNAGILRMAPFLDMPLAEMREIFETNFWATIETVRAAAPFMEKQGGGHVVQVGSAVSRRGLPFMAAYSASKAALLGLTEGMRVELKPKGITFSLVLPGGIDTEMPNNLDRSRLPAGYPERRGYRITAERAAEAVVAAIERRRPEINVPWWTAPGLMISALFPSLADRIVARGYKNVFKK